MKQEPTRKITFDLLTPNDLQRRRAVSHLKIEIPSKQNSAGSVARRDLIPALKG
jgi:hypothetical protein